ncbi:MAG: hypothetical protein QOI54_3135 [Actinomycetota bacterium]|nr:hypothetical protein [Actinomycetota bacterium]
MTVRRIAALFAALLTAGFGLAVTAAWAVADATYPPTVQGGSTGTAVEGTKVGSNVGSGASNGVASNAGGGLPHTGFEGALLWTALALVVAGLALMLVTRRRHQA